MCIQYLRAEPIPSTGTRTGRERRSSDRPMVALGVQADGKMYPMKHSPNRSSEQMLPRPDHVGARQEPRRRSATLRGLAFAVWVCGCGGGALAACKDPPAAGVDWTECDKHRLVLNGANLAGAKLTGSDLNGTDLQRANLSGADLTRASVDRVRFSSADLSRAKLAQLNGYRANFSAANLSGADLTKAELARASLASANLSQANLSKAELQRANLEGSILDGANLTGADLARTNLAKARLDGTRMENARTYLTRIEGVNLSRAVGLNQSQVDSACGDATTQLPKGLKTPANWPCKRDE